MNSLIKIKKENNKNKIESKKEIRTVNKYLRASMQKKTTKQSLRPPISIPTTVINNIMGENRLSSFGLNNNSINNNAKNSTIKFEEEKDKKLDEKINEKYIRKIQS